MDFTQYIYNSFAVGRVVFLLVQGRQTCSSHAFIFLLPKISSHPFCMYAKATEQTLFCKYAVDVYYTQTLYASGGYKAVCKLALCVSSCPSLRRCVIITE